MLNKKIEMLFQIYILSIFSLRNTRIKIKSQTISDKPIQFKLKRFRSVKVKPKENDLQN